MASTKSWLNAMQQGQQNYQHGSFLDAIQFFSLATKITPSRVEGWINLGVTQVETGAYKDALITLHKAIGLNPNIMPSYLALGDAARFLGDLNAAFVAYQHAVRLQRTPMSLNKFAALHRVNGNPEKAEALYQEALQMAPDFTLAKVNLATVQIELQRFDEAKKQLDSLDDVPLPPAEKEEVNSAQTSLELYFRLQPTIEIALQENDLAPMEKALQAVPKELLHVDQGILDGIRRYADSAKSLSLPVEDEALSLPEDWPLIEALFMIPLVESVDEYRQLKEKMAIGIQQTTTAWKASVNMEPVVRAARNNFPRFSHNSIAAEMHLRYWHVLISAGIKDMAPGQFKITQNQTCEDLKKRRAEPHLTTGTFRQFISEIYLELPPGLLRGLVAMIAISDIHPFPDGNGRIAQIWLNRELESVGQIPPLFTQEMGFQGKLGAAISKCRRSGGDLLPLIELIIDAQQFARNFCEELAKDQNQSSLD